MMTIAGFHDHPQPWWLPVGSRVSQNNLIPMVNWSTNVRIDDVKVKTVDIIMMNRMVDQV